MAQHRPTRRKRTSGNWQSSVIGSHNGFSSGKSGRGSHGAGTSRLGGSSGSYPQRPSASGRRSASHAGSYDSRRRGVSLEGRTAELHQMRPSGASVDMSSSRRRPADPAELIRKRRRSFFVKVAIAIVAVVLLAFAIGGFVFQSVVAGNMSLKDSTIKSALVTPENDADPYYVLVTGVSDDQEASYLGVLRIDPSNSKITLLNVPSNIASGKVQLRDLPNSSDGGTLVSEVSSLLGVDIAHYVSISEDGLVSLVDSLGGIDVNVSKLVDDPRAGTIVIEPGQQTLNGTQTLTYVRAYNYEDGRETRATVQYQVLQAIISKVSSQGGIDFMKAADAFSNGVQTDLGYDNLTSLLDFYSGATLMYGTIPGTTYTSDGRTFFRVADTKWESVKSLFTSGEEPTTEVKTSKSSKKKLSIIVLNGSGITGNAQKAEAKLKEAGYTVKETGNAESFVYEETLVVYRDSSHQKDAEAMVETLGVGRAVAAGVNYSLTTDIQVMVGKDWVS